MELLKFQCSDVDQAVFYRRNENMLMVVLVHIDDCTLIASTAALISGFKAQIAKHVEISDLGELHWLLGIEIKQNREARTIHISQRAYIQSILRRYNFHDLKPLSIPMDPAMQLSTAQAPSTMQEFAAM